MPIAANLENTERYVWQLPSNPPPRFYIRVEANDQAGNLGMAQSGEPVSLDLAQPTVSILTVDQLSVYCVLADPTQHTLGQGWTFLDRFHVQADHWRCHPHAARRRQSASH